jgi:WD40 repeat protein
MADAKSRRLRLHRHLAEAAQEWKLLEHDASALYRGARLAQVLEWAIVNPRELNAMEQAFIDASKELAMREEAEREAQHRRELEAAQKLAETEQRAASNLRRRAVYLSGALIVAAVLAIIALIFGQQSSDNAQQAQFNFQNAQTAEASAVNEAQVRATAQADALAQREEALRQASVGLAAQAVSELQGTTPERSVPIALEALENYPYTPQAESALAQAVNESKPFVDLATDYNQSIPSGAAWSPDGKRLAGGYYDRGGVVIIWDVFANRELNRLMDVSGSNRDCGIRDMAWSPVSDLLAIVPTDNGYGVVCLEPAIWDLKTNSKILALTAALSTTIHIDWSHDGQYLLTAHIDGTAKIWDSKNGTQALVLSGHTGSVQDAAWSPSNAQIATASQDRTAKIWDAKTGKEVITLAGHANTVAALSWSPDSKYIVTSSTDGTGRVWDAISGEVLFVLAGHTGELMDVDWSPDGETISTVALDGTSRVWDATNGALLFELRLVGLVGNYSKVAWSPTSKHLVMSGEKAPRVWDLSQSSSHLPKVNTDWVNTALWSPSGTRIASSSYDGSARIFDAVTGKQMIVITAPIVFHGLYLVTRWAADCYDRRRWFLTYLGCSNRKIIDRAFGVYSKRRLCARLVTGWCSHGNQLLAG